MEQTTAMIGRTTNVLGGAATIALAVMALGVLGIWNEVRYQGCVGRIDSRGLINATAGKQVVPPIECHRLPLIH